MYSIMAMDASIEPDSRIYPMTRVGRDLIANVHNTLRYLPRVSSDGIIEDENPNNRVELRYTDAETREERVTGGVEPLDTRDLLPLEDLDGLSINLVSGREVGREVLQEKIEKLHFPIHLDLHSYLIDYDESGTHYWRCPDGWKMWLDLCDILQVNRDELFTIAGHDGEIFDVGNEVWKVCGQKRTSCLLVTDGEKGSWGWYSDKGGKARNCYVPPKRDLDVVDPTGSGDVYGASFFLSRLNGESVESAMIHATRKAGINCKHSGTRNLNEYLREGEAQLQKNPDLRNEEVPS
jgi:sugar/nucleoside kinase (ribokinase family)